MNFVRLSLDVNYGDYSYQDASSPEMAILGCFLSIDVRCNNRTFFRDWALSDERAWGVSGNITTLERVDGYIYLTDQISEEETPAELKMTADQLVRVIDDWREKVCKSMPKRVVIKHENGEFLIETRVSAKHFEELANKKITIALEYILGMELKFSDQGVVVIEGFCHDSMGYIDTKKFFELIDRMDLSNGAYGGQLTYQSFTAKHKASFFPSDWSREKVVENIYAAYNNFIKSGAEAEFKCGKYHITGETEEGMKIRMHITTNGEIKSAYPAINNI